MKKILILITHPNEFASYVETLAASENITKLDITNYCVSTTTVRYQFCLIETEVLFDNLHHALANSDFDTIDVTRFQNDQKAIQEHLARIIKNSYQVKDNNGNSK